MRRLTLLTFAVFALLAAPPSASAGPLDPGVVSAKASWVVHLDAAGLRRSEIGQAGMRLLEEAESDDEEYQKIMRELDIDPVHDLESITLYGSTEAPDEGVVVVETTADIEHALKRLSELTEGELRIDKRRFEGMTIHEVSGDEDFFLYIDELGDSRSRVYAAPLRGLLLHAVSVAEGRTPSIDRHGDLLMDQRMRRGAFITVAATDLSALDHDGPESIAFQKAERIFFQAGEDDGRAFAAVAFNVPSEQEANQLSQIAMGALALGQLVGASDPEARPLAELLQSVRVNTDGRTVSVAFDMDTEHLLRGLGDLEGADWDDVIEEGGRRGWWSNGH